MPDKTCPVCGGDLEEVNSCGVVDWDGRWEAQTTRYRCPANHLIFLVRNGDDIDQAERESADA